MPSLHAAGPAAGAFYLHNKPNSSDRDITHVMKPQIPLMRLGTQPYSMLLVLHLMYFPCTPACNQRGIVTGFSDYRAPLPPHKRHLQGQCRNLSRMVWRHCTPLQMIWSDQQLTVAPVAAHFCTAAAVQIVTIQFFFSRWARYQPLPRFAATERHRCPTL